MTNKILDKIKTILAHPTEMTSDKLKGFIEETTQYFQILQSRATSANQIEREKALQEALDLKSGLEEQMGAISKAIGMTPEQMAALAANAEHLNPEDRKILEDAQAKLMNANRQPSQFQTAAAY